MAKFKYTAMDNRGKEKKGRIDGENEQDAASKLKAQGLFPTNIMEVQSNVQKRGGHSGGARKRSGGGGMVLGTPKIRRKALVTFTRQLATLLDAGLPLVRALRTLERQAKRDPALRHVVGELANTVEGGGTFSEAMAGHPKSFDKLYVNMIRAGEASGAMESVLKRLAEHLEKAARIAGKVKSAMIYPMVVLFVALSITAGLMIFIVPKFATIFSDMLGEDKQLPALTRFVIGVSDFMKDNWILIIFGIPGIFFLMGMIKKTKGGGQVMDFIMLKMPPFNILTTKTVVARFCRTLGTLMQSGVAVLTALQIVRDTVGNELVSRAVQKVHEAVKEGSGMSKPLESTQVFPGMVVSMIEVGEETGALPEMLARIADTYEEEVDQAVEALTSLIEPVMIVFLAVIVGGIVIALFLPLIALISEMGQ